MITKEMKLEDFLANKDKISELLVESYIINFDISKKLSTTICDDKIKSIPDYFNQGSIILIGTYQDDILAGILWLYKHEHFEEFRLHVNQVIVDKHFRGMKIGSLLMNEAEKIAQSYEINNIDLFVSETNKSAINMYESIGYKTERRYMNKVLQEEK